MRKLGIILVGVLCVVGGAAAVWKIAYPTYSYRYRLFLELEVDSIKKSGTSVIEVAWVGQPNIPSVGSFIPHVRGQGVFIDLGSRGALVSALDAPTAEEGGQVKWPYGVAARFLAARAFGNRSTYQELPDLPRLRGRRDLTADNMVPLIWFSNISDVTTARQITVADIPGLLGPTARLAAATLEITDAAVVTDLDKKLPWYAELAKNQKAHGVFGRPGEFKIIYSTFIGE
jgi:hypothetical protein